MKVATVDELRDSFDRIEGWLAGGEAVQLTKQGLSFATITPITQVGLGEKTWTPWPDIVARARAYCGDTVLSDEWANDLIGAARGERFQ